MGRRRFKRSTNSKNESPDSDYYQWATIRRLDSCPVANVYHFVCDDSDVIRINPRERPLITLTDGAKIQVFDPTRLHPKMPSLPGNNYNQKVWVWRASPVYESPEQWLEEVRLSGEAVCWLPNRAWVEKWVKSGFEPYVLIAWQIPGIVTPTGQIIAAFRPKIIYYPFNDQAPDERLEQIDRYGTMMAQNRIRVADTVVYTDQTKMSFLPLSTKAM